MFRFMSVTAALAVSLCSLPAFAAEGDVPAGRRSVLFEFSNIDETCQTIGRAKGKVLTEPSHGKVTFEWVSARLGENTRFCKGKYAKVLRISYTPDKGFRGDDTFRIGVSSAKFSDGSGTTFTAETVTVHVK